MAEPCKQESNIGELQATIEAIATSLSELRAGQAQFILLLQEIARQGEQIKSGLARTDKIEKDVDGLFKRMRDVELAPGKQAGTLQMAVIAAAISALIAYLFKKLGG
jgi:hypothetical protein